VRGQEYACKAAFDAPKGEESSYTREKGERGSIFTRGEGNTKDCSLKSIVTPSNGKERTQSLSVEGRK